MVFFCLVLGFRPNLRVFHSTSRPNLFARLAIILFLIAIIPDYALSNSALQPFEDDPNEPWHIHADEIRYDKNLDQYIAKGHVTITKQGKHLTADFVRFDQQTMKVVAVGNAVMKVGNDVMVGDRMEMDLKAETGTVYNGTIFLEDKHFYIKGDKIQKVGPDSYTTDKGCFTTCDGDHPAWKITGKNIKITIEGYGFAKHAALRVKATGEYIEKPGTQWVGYVPVMYSPWLVFPVKTKRQSGLLPPQFGYSDRKWEEYIQPLYLVIDDSADITFYWHHMGRRGQKLGLEYRYVLSENSKGTLMYDYLDDRKADDGNPQLNEDWGYFDDNVPRPNSDRYWFRMKHDQPAPFGLWAQLDLDVVSDQDYLKEFEYGYTGFEETNEYFTKTFGRELDDENDAMRVNRFNLSRGWSGYSLNGELRWYDDVVNRRQGDTMSTTLQKLPFVEFNGAKQQILESPFYFNLDSEYTYFYRDEGQRVHRADLYPRIYLPYKYKYYFSIEPSMGFRETIYHFDKYEYRGPTKEQNMFRDMYDLKIDLSSEVYRIFSGIGENNNKIKHTVRPQIVYTYIPNKEQNKYPSFDGIDRIGKRRRLTYSLTNTLTSKSLVKKKANGPLNREEDSRHPEFLKQRKADGSLNQNEDNKQPGFLNQKKAKVILHETENNPPPKYTYQQFCRFKLEQSYDINEAKEDNPALRTGKRKKEPFSPVYGEIELTPGRYFSMQADVTRSWYKSYYQSYNVAFNIWDKRKDRLFVERRYNHDSSDSIFYDLSVIITKKLTAHADYERNLLDGRDIKKSFALFYKSQCWSLLAEYTHEGNDRRYMFVVSLYGIGEFTHSLIGGTFENPYLPD